MKRHLFAITLGTLALLFSLALPATGANDWPRFRGPNGDGISPDTGLQTSWPESGPQVAFKVPLGKGFSGISAVDGRLYTLFSQDGGEFLVDIEATWRFNDMFAVSVGGENVFDTEPDADGHFVAELLGVRTALTSPFGNNGGFWYVRLAADFN